MAVSAYFAAIAVVLGIAFGQVLFKAAAISWNEAGTYFDKRTLALVLSAFTLYFVTSLAWVYVLKRIDLGKVYPFMALSFVVVPLASALIFGERFSNQYYLGVVFLVAGIILCTQS